MFQITLDLQIHYTVITNYGYTEENPMVPRNSL